MIGPDRRARLESVCDRALALPAEERAAYVRNACGDDEALRADVDSLLAYASKEAALDRPLGELIAHVLDAGASGPTAALPAGTRFAHYEIVQIVDAGGMGQVYRARDTELGRFAALKVLRPEVATDRERVARLEHEARVLAAVSHPNIAAIYGVVRGADRIALAMELVEGRTLTARLARGALVVPDANAIVRQLAAALEAAHDKGIVHRDLKPSNVMVSDAGLVKLLDFGLAKATDAMPHDVVATAAGAPETRTGTVMGTAAYMSPEQATGEKVDRRTDIWALGCVWFELLTGGRVFAGDSSMEIVAAVLREEPDWSRLPAEFSSRLRGVLQRCLAKASHERLHDVSTVRFVLEEHDAEPVAVASAVSTHVASGAATPHPWGAWPIAAAALLAVALASLGASLWSRDAGPGDPERGPLVRSAVVLPDGMQRSLGVSPALSRDGTMMVFRADRDGRAQLFRRRLADAEVSLIDGTENGGTPFFSPDGHWLGFTVGNEIKKVRIEGGQPQTVATLPALAGASWGDDDVIVVGRRQSSGLWRVPASGGAPERLTIVTAEDGDNDHRFPQVLPRGRGVLFAVCTGPEETARIVVLDARTGARKDLLTGSASARYIATGHLVYARNAELMAAPFDLERLEITGPAVRVAEGVGESIDGVPEYAFSDGGDLAYFPGWSGGVRNALTLVGLDGSAKDTAFPLLPLYGLRFSPDGRRIALFVGGAKNNAWVYDIDRESSTQVTAGRYHGPMWTRDGRLVVSKGAVEGQRDLVLRDADVEGPEQTLLAWHRSQYGGGWTADKRLVVERQGEGVDWDIVALDLATRAVSDVVVTPASEEHPRVSPDGRWLAYRSNDSGRYEAFVRGLGPGAGRQRVSVNGVQSIGWAPDGRTLYFTGLTDRTMWASRVATTPVLTVGPPTRLFPTEPYNDLFDISPDGTRFAMIRRGLTPPRNRLELVQNALEGVPGAR